MEFTTNGTDDGGIHIQRWSLVPMTDREGRHQPYFQYEAKADTYSSNPNAKSSPVGSAA